MVRVHAGLPAAGKTTAARAEVTERGGLLIDKDRANPLESAMARAASGDPDDRDSASYCEQVYPVTLSLVGELACGVLRVGSTAVVDIPLLAEAGQAAAAGERLGERLGLLWGLDPDLITVVWHEVEPDLQHERMVERAAGRDREKLADWAAYQRQLAQQMPDRASIAHCVDELVDGHGTPLREGTPR